MVLVVGDTWSPRNLDSELIFLFWTFLIFISPLLVNSVSVISCYFTVTDILMMFRISDLLQPSLPSGLDLPNLCLIAVLINWLLQPNWSVMHSGFHLILIPWPHPRGPSFFLTTAFSSLFKVNQKPTSLLKPSKSTQDWGDLFILLLPVA